MASIKKIWKKIVNYGAKLRPELYFRTRYIWYREHCPIEENLILLESLDGVLPTDNIGAILEELCSNGEYQTFTICLSGKRGVRAARKQYVKQYGKHRVILLSYGTRKYFKILATAKFLVTEVSFHFSFIKRPEQVYWNTWHGTPLKTLGKQVKSDYAMIGNVQRNFLDANYLLCPNEFTKEVLIQDYMLSNLAKTTLLLSGYPRNEWLLNKEQGEQIRAIEQCKEKQVIAFLPTWRGTMEAVNQTTQQNELQRLLQQLDSCLSEQQVLFVKLHPMVGGNLSFSEFRHIQAMPTKYPTYRFLSAVDVLVTDYSSVFFDFAVTGKKIILFPYDREAYEAERGFYVSLEELPFPKVYSVQELAKEIKRPKQYEDTKFLQKFCPYDKLGVTKALCERVILGKTLKNDRTGQEQQNSFFREQAVADNGKPNIVFFLGGFEKNGITTAAVNLLHRLDHKNYNVYVIYRMNDVKGNQEVIRVLPDTVGYLGFYRAESMTLFEFFWYVAWKLLKKPSFSKIKPILERYADRERQRLFGNCRIDHVIQYSGYVPELLMVMAKMPCRRTVFVHSNMERESDGLQKIEKELLRYVYQTYDTVAVVTEELVPITKRICDTARIVVCKNMIDTARICRLAQKELVFDTATVYNMPKEQIFQLLSSSKKKLITIGRFSKEKGQERLIKAFERLHHQFPDTCLFLVGGYGELYEETVAWAKQTDCAKDIAVIRYLSNPYPLLQQCDALVLSSYYEGFGLVLVEADILGVPCFSTKCGGPEAFFLEHGGRLVENSEDGIYEGLQEAVLGTLPKRFTIDYETYNQEAVKQWETLLHCNQSK